GSMPRDYRTLECEPSPVGEDWGNHHATLWCLRSRPPKGDTRAVTTLRNLWFLCAWSAAVSGCTCESKSGGGSSKPPAYVNRTTESGNTAAAAGFAFPDGPAPKPDAGPDAAPDGPPK